MNGHPQHLHNVIGLSEQGLMYGRVQLLHPNAKVYSTRAGIDQLKSLQFFHPKVVRSLADEFLGVRLLFVTIMDFCISEEGKLWLAHFVRDMPEVQLVLINIHELMAAGQSGRAAHAKRSNQANRADTNDSGDALLGEVALRREIEAIIPMQNYLLYQLDLSGGHYELIRWLRPLLRMISWKENALCHLSERPLPEQVGDAIIRAQSDVLVHDPQMHYLCYNL